MSKSIESELDQTITVIDKGMAELHEYIKMREDAEKYLDSHPHARRVLGCIFKHMPDLQQRFANGQIDHRVASIV